MTVTKLRRTSALIGSALAVIAALALLPGAARATGTTTLSAQTAYNCQLFTSPPPPDMYEASVTASIQMTAPSSVYPGETINISGTLTLQFPESIRAVAIAGGFNTVQGVSTTINLGVDAAGTSTDVFADEWQTPPTQVGNPLQVSGVLTMPPLTVPKNATGTYELQMPENGATANTVESTPAKVAFTAVATASGPGGTSPIKVACYLPGSSPELGQIPIVAAPVAATKTTATKATPATTSAATSSATKASAAKSSAAKSSATKASATKSSAAKSSATKASAASTASAAKSSGTSKAAAVTPAAGTTQAAQATQSSGASAATGASGTAAASAANPSAASSGTSATSSGSGQSATAGNTGAATPAASSGTAAVTPSDTAVDDVGTPVSSSTTRSGVYVSTTLLVLGGFLICLASIGYALLTRYRLNSIRRELDD